MNHQDHVGLLKAAVPPGVATWADLGSGTGAFTLALADILGPGARIVSVDRDGGALREQARTMGERFPEVALDQRQADFTGELQLSPLDGLLMANSLHFVRDKRELLPRLLGAIRPRGRFVLCDVVGLSYEDIGQSLGVPLGTVRSRIHRGRAQLRVALEHRRPRQATRAVPRPAPVSPVPGGPA